MFSRLPLPIRFLHPSPFRPSDGARLLPVYKHTGLPVFAQKEVKRCTAPSQLYYPFSSTEGTSPHDQQDLSDSLSGRVRDALPPGPTPYYALPQVSPAVLAHLQKSSRAKGNNSVERLNRYTAEQRGVSLYVNSKSDLLLVQRMSEMGLVYKKYRVLCHVPVSLGKAAIAALQQKEQSMHQHAVHRPNLVLSGKRQREQNGTEGISFAGAADFGKQKKSWDIPSPHPYVKGGLIDEQRQLLLHHGRLQCRLCMGEAAPSTEERNNKSSSDRLHRLFQKSTATATDDNSASHPWMAAADLLRPVLLTSADQKETYFSKKSTNDDGATTVDCTFHLLAVSRSYADETEEEYVALYEVYGESHRLHAETISKVFQLCGFPVVNDYVNAPLDKSPLLQALQAVRETVQGIPPPLLSELPAKVQFDIKHQFSVEEFVIHPLMGQPVDQTEAYYLEKMISSQEAKENEANDNDEDEEERQQIRKEWNDQIEKTVLSKRNNTKLNTLHKVLQLSKKKDAHTILSNRHLRRLALGSGIELISISLPDIRLPPTLYRLQHLFLQEQTSPGSAVRPNETDFTFSSFHAHSLLLPIYAKQLVRQTPNTTRRNQRPVLLDRLDWVEGVCYSPGTEENSRALPPTDTPPNHKAVDAGNNKNVVYVFHRKVASLTPMEAYVLFGEASLHKDHYKWVFSVPIPPEFNDLRQQWYTAQQNEDSKEKKQIPIYFQPENCLSYHCHFCGREGHCWQQCDEYAMKDAESTLFLGEETPTGKAYHQLTADTDDNTSSVPPLSEEEFHKALLSHHQATDVLQAAKEQLTRGSDNNDYSVQDTVMITRDRHTQHAMRRETNTNNEDEVIIPVPNKAATIDYASSFKLRAESKKPSMHRRVLRCGYCSGKHHISQCPKLKQ